MHLVLVKTASGMFAPYGEDSQGLCAKVKVGQLLHGEFTRMRNYEFHKKFFALMQLGFDVFTETAQPTEYRGEAVLPEFRRFWKDIVILAGYYNSEYRVDKSVRLEAKSISFGSMDQTEFEALFSACINVILNRVLGNGMTDEQLRARIDEVLRFDT